MICGNNNSTGLGEYLDPSNSKTKQQASHPAASVFYRESELIPQSIFELGLATVGMDPVKNASIRPQSFWSCTCTLESWKTRSDFS